MIGRILLAFGIGWALFWLGVRYLLPRRGEPSEAIRRWRRPLIGVTAVVVPAGWLVFFIVWEELGLLLVLLGAVPLTILIATVKRERLLSPMDGPTFGETGSG